MKTLAQNLEIADPLPSSKDAERSVLGSIVLDNELLPEAIEKLETQDFFFRQHQLIFLAMSHLRTSIDYVTLVDELTRRNQLDAVGGPAYVSSLAEGLPRTRNLGQYVRIIRNMAARRRLISFSLNLQEVGYGKNRNGSGTVNLEDLRRQAIELFEDLSPEDTTSKIKTVTGKELGLMKVKPRDYLLDGLLNCRSMNEIFAWRGVGKTWLALYLAHAVANGGGFLRWQASRPRKVLFVDGELDAASLQQRVGLLEASEEYLQLLCADMQDDPFPNLATPKAQRIIEDALGDAEFLILDNLSALAPSSNETEGEDWISIQTWLLGLRRRGIASLFLHHAGHAGWSRGTTRREDLLDIVIELRRPKDYVANEGLRFELHFTKTRGMLGPSAEPLEVRLTTDLDNRLTWTYRDLEDGRLAQIVELRTAGESWRDIAKATGTPRTTAERLYNARPK